MESYNEIVLIRAHNHNCKPSEPQQRVKRHHFKVRSGCETCRTRRIKCDETKPTCIRCLKLGRSCVYDRVKTFIPQDRTATVQTAKNFPSLSGKLNIPQGDTDEQRFFDYYLQSKKSRFANTVVTLPVMNITIAYLNLVPQIAQTSQTVRHAISASASAEEHLLRQEDAPDWLIRQQERYFKSTVNAILKDDLSIEELLMCCLLLFAYSCFTSDYKAVELHFQSGLRLVEERKQTSRASFLCDVERALIDLQLTLTTIYQGECPIPVEECHPHASKRGIPVGCV